MSKKTLAALAVLGLSSFLSAEDVAANTCTPSSCGQVLAAANTASSNSTMSADQQMFCNKLNKDGQEAFKAMDAKGRAMAMKMASASCKGKNDCKGKGCCKTAMNECAGKNECKGKGGCGAKEANKAVEVAAKMCGKRNSAEQ